MALIYVSIKHISNRILDHVAEYRNILLLILLLRYVSFVNFAYLARSGTDLKLECRLREIARNCSVL